MVLLGKMVLRVALGVADLLPTQRAKGLVAQVLRVKDTQGATVPIPDGAEAAVVAQGLLAETHLEVRQGMAALASPHQSLGLLFFMAVAVAALHIMITKLVQAAAEVAAMALAITTQTVPTELPILAEAAVVVGTMLRAALVVQGL